MHTQPLPPIHWRYHLPVFVSYVHISGTHSSNHFEVKPHFFDTFSALWLAWRHIFHRAVTYRVLALVLLSPRWCPRVHATPTAMRRRRGPQTENDPMPPRKKRPTRSRLCQMFKGWDRGGRWLSCCGGRTGRGERGRGRGRRGRHRRSQGDLRRRRRMSQG